MARLETTLRARGPYSLALVARGGGRTRHFAGGVFTTVFEAGSGRAHARVWQRRDGALELRLDADEADAAVERLRFVLALDDDHTEFVRRFARDPLIGDATRRLQGLRPLRTATVTHALLRALCGQLIAGREAAAIESRVLRRMCREHAGLVLPPRREDLASASPAALCGLGLAARRSAALVRVLRELDPERLRDADTAAVVRRLVRERTLGPWSAGVVCLEGLGRYEHGLVGDLGLIKLCTVLRGRPATSEDTAELLGRYEEWAGLASLYLLAGVRVDPRVHGLTHLAPDARREEARRPRAA